MSLSMLAYKSAYKSNVWFYAWLYVDPFASLFLFLHARILPKWSVCISRVFILYLSEIYIAPLQGNYSEALPAQAQADIEVLRSLENELDKSRGI